MVFAVPTDVETAYEGSLPAGSEARVQYLIDTASARLRLLLPKLEDRIAAADLAAGGTSDLALMTRDAVVRAVIRRLGSTGQPQVSSQTQSAGPWTVTNRYTTDSSRTFPDDDLDLLRGHSRGSGAMGTIKLGLVEWHNQ